MCNCADLQEYLRVFLTRRCNVFPCLCRDLVGSRSGIQRGRTMLACGEPKVASFISICACALVSPMARRSSILFIYWRESKVRVETKKVELWGKVISLRGDRCCETTERGMNPCGRVRVGDFPVGSSREWSGGYAFLYSLSCHVSK